MRRQVVLSLGTILLLSGCGQVGSNARAMMGLDHQAPDAFAVSTHAPLEVPANLNAPLPPPQPGAARPQEITPQTLAQSAVVGRTPDSAVAATAPSTAEQALLQQAGATQVNSTIRTQVNTEASEDAKAQTGPLDWIAFWRDKPRPGVAVDAKAEAERLRAARAAGQSATQGATPVIEDSGRLSVPKEIQ